MEEEGRKANIRLLLHGSSLLFYSDLCEIKIIIRILVDNEVFFAETQL
jgi:hypothetical protein